VGQGILQELDRNWLVHLKPIVSNFLNLDQHLRYDLR
jgi:hypothetical protein